MALSDIQAALGQTFARQLVRAWNRQSVFLQHIPILPGGGAGGGKNVSWVVEFSGAKAGAFAEGSDFDPNEFGSDKPVDAVLPWGQYRSAFEITHLEINTAANNMGNPEALDDLFEERLRSAITKITSIINADVISGTGTDISGNPTIVGILTACAATGTYAGISKATYPEWAGNVSANGGTPRDLSLELLAQAEQLGFVASGQSPELLITTPTLLTKYESLFTPYQRVVNDGMSPIRAFQGSAERLAWRGRDVIRDKDMPAGTLLMVRPSGLELRVLPWAPMPKNVQGDLRPLLSSTGNEAAALGALVNVYPLARTGSAIKFGVELYCQLKVARPNEHVVIKDIKET